MTPVPAVGAEAVGGGCAVCAALSSEGWLAVCYSGGWRYRLTVRTEPSQGSNTGSIPVSATNYPFHSLGFVSFRQGRYDIP